MNTETWNVCKINECSNLIFMTFQKKHLLMIFGRKNLDGDVRCLAHHIVNVLPVVEGDQLEGCQHGPQQVVETGEAVIWIFSNTTKADKTVWT